MHLAERAETESAISRSAQFQEGLILLREKLLEPLRGAAAPSDPPAGASGAGGLSGGVPPPRVEPMVLMGIGRNTNRLWLRDQP
eukprot:1642676-Alexandrium_andersonii.AAC.1